MSISVIIIRHVTWKQLQKLLAGLERLLSNDWQLGHVSFTSELVWQWFVFCCVTGKNIILLHNGFICTEQFSFWWQTSRDNQTASELRYFSCVFVVIFAGAKVMTNRLIYIDRAIVHCSKLMHDTLRNDWIWFLQLGWPLCRPTVSKHWKNQEPWYQTVSATHRALSFLNPAADFWTNSTSFLQYLQRYVHTRWQMRPVAINCIKLNLN